MLIIFILQLYISELRHTNRWQHAHSVIGVHFAGTYSSQQWFWTLNKHLLAWLDSLSSHVVSSLQEELLVWTFYSSIITHSVWTSRLHTCWSTPSLWSAVFIMFGFLCLLKLSPIWFHHIFTVIISSSNCQYHEMHRLLLLISLHIFGMILLSILFISFIS